MDSGSTQEARKEDRQVKKRKRQRPAEDTENRQAVDRHTDSWTNWQKKKTEEQIDKNKQQWVRRIEEEEISWITIHITNEQTLKGFLSSNCRCWWMWSRRSVSMSRHSGWSKFWTKKTSKIWNLLKGPYHATLLSRNYRYRPALL